LIDDVIGQVIFC